MVRLKEISPYTIGGTALSAKYSLRFNAILIQYQVCVRTWNSFLLASVWDGEKVRQIVGQCFALNWIGGSGDRSIVSAGKKGIRTE